MNPDLLHILQHTVGVDQYGRGQRYRNHFVTGPGSDDFSKCRSLVEEGLMHDCGPAPLTGGMHTFYVTDKGIETMIKESPEPPKSSRSKQRYLAFLSADSGMTFGEWLHRPNSHERRA